MFSPRSTKKLSLKKSGYVNSLLRNRTVQCSYNLDSTKIKGPFHMDGSRLIIIYSHPIIYEILFKVLSKIKRQNIIILTAPVSGLKTRWNHCLVR